MPEENWEGEGDHCPNSWRIDGKAREGGRRRVNPFTVLKISSAYKLVRQISESFEK